MRCRAGAQADEILQKLQTDKEREHRLRCERRALIQQAKLDKVERQKKREEFMRMQVMEKIEDKMERTRVRALCPGCREGAGRGGVGFLVCE